VELSLRRLAPSIVLFAFLIGCGGESGPGPSTPTPTPTTAPSTPTPTSSPAASVSILHDFIQSIGEGGQPGFDLLRASDGNFYGVTPVGGANSCGQLTNWCGALFKITPAGVYTTLRSFGATPTDGTLPSGRLAQGSDGALYGTTATGGVYGNGTIFRYDLGGTYMVIHSFGEGATSGRVPTFGLIAASDGDLYGITSSGGEFHSDLIPAAGSNAGMMFKVTIGGQFTPLVSFGATPSMPVLPEGLMQASDGNFYGVSQLGGANSCGISGAPNSCGTIFRVTPQGTLTIIHSFGGVNGPTVAKYAPTEGSDGFLYGVTLQGGSTNGGVAYKIGKSGGFSVLSNFRASPTDGYGPWCLTRGSDGNFYGVTGSGGANGGDLSGTFFRLTPSASRTTLHSFGPVNGGAHHPLGCVVEGERGSFYGTVRYSDPRVFGGSGAVFRATVF
jgi:uncharacterized repeat protein (TIGR03803 family)